VRSEFAFVYFHDDEIEPTYTERLVEALRHRPDAVSAHCDVVLYGTGSEKLRRGSNYDGSPAERLLTYLVSPDRGELLRSLVLTASPESRIRMTPQRQYEMALVTAGPACECGNRCTAAGNNEREDSRRRIPRYSFEKVVDGCRSNAIMARALVDDLQAFERARSSRFGLAVYFTSDSVELEAARGGAPPGRTRRSARETRGAGLPSAANRLERTSSSSRRRR
jgi:hypothetical protein